MGDCYRTLRLQSLLANLYLVSDKLLVTLHFMKAEFELCSYVREFSCQGGKRMLVCVSYTVVWLLF
jgi:hypothetical protein